MEGGKYIKQIVNGNANTGTKRYADVERYANTDVEKYTKRYPDAGAEK